MLQHRLHDDVLHALARVERSVGVLEDHLHLAADRRHGGEAEPGDVLPVDEHLAAGGAVDAGDGLGDRGLAAAGFAHQPHHLAALDREADAVDGMDDPARRDDAAAGQAQAVEESARHVELLFQVADVQKAHDAPSTAGKWQAAR